MLLQNSYHLPITIAIDQTVIVDFHGSRIYQMKEKIRVFYRDVLLLWNVFAVLNLMLMVRWLIENNPLRGKEPFLIIKG